MTPDPESGLRASCSPPLPTFRQTRVYRLPCPGPGPAASAACHLREPQTAESQRKERTSRERLPLVPRYQAPSAPFPPPPSPRPPRLAHSRLRLPPTPWKSALLSLESATAVIRPVSNAVSLTPATGSSRLEFRDNAIGRKSPETRQGRRGGRRGDGTEPRGGLRGAGDSSHRRPAIGSGRGCVTRPALEASRLRPSSLPSGP